MKSTQQKITLDDGATTTVEQWGDAGPVILCVHGMTSSRRSWTRFAERFANRYRLIAYDQRGHGDSADITGPMSLERGVRDLENVAAVTGGDVLLGHSWGGAVVIRGGPRVGARKVIALDPMVVNADDVWYGEFLDELREQLAPQGEERAALLRKDYAEWHPDDVEGKVHAMLTMTAAPIAGLRDDNHDGGWDLRADIADYTLPLLLLMAGRDGSIVPPEVMDEIRARHGARVEIVIFEGQPHNLHRTDFEAVAGAMDEFLSDR